MSGYDDVGQMKGITKYGLKEREWNAGLVYSDVTWSAILILNEPRLGTDTT